MSRRSAEDGVRGWQGTCRSQFAVPIFVLFVALGVVVAIGIGGVGGAAAGVGIAMAGLTVLSIVEIRVVVTDGALVIQFSGPLRWPTMALSLADVATIEAIDVTPLRYGGWGYRGSLRLFRRSAVVLRRGPGLRLALNDGRVFVVTVDDPEVAVAAATPQLLDTAP